MRLYHSARLAFVLLLTLIPCLAHAQGAPNTVWARGGHSYSISGVFITPDGHTLVSTGGGLIKIHHLPDGLFVRSWANPGVLYSSALSPDGTRLATAGYSGPYYSTTESVWLYSIPDGKLLWTYQGFTSSQGNAASKAYAPAFSADGARIYCVATDPDGDQNADDVIALNATDGTLLGRTGGLISTGGTSNQLFSVAASSSTAPVLVGFSGLYRADPNTLAGLDTDTHGNPIPLGGISNPIGFGSSFSLSPDGTLVGGAGRGTPSYYAVNLPLYNTADGSLNSLLAFTGDSYKALPQFSNMLWTDPESVFVSGFVSIVDINSNVSSLTRL